MPIFSHAYIRYDGSRLNLMEQYSKFIVSKIMLEEVYDGINEDAVIEVILFDNNIYHLGLTSGNIYAKINNCFVRVEDSYIMNQDIILSKYISFINGVINMKIDLNGEFIFERYKFKVFVTNVEPVNKIIVDSEIGYEDLI